MTITIERPELSALSTSELAELAEYMPGEIAAERSRRAAAQRRYAARNAGLAGEWMDAAHAQYLAAEAACCGNLVRKGSAVTDGWSLWSGTDAWAMQEATEELREFWYANPRVTVGRYRQQATAGRVAQREDQAGRPAPVVPAPAVWRETTVTVGSWPRAAWWVIRAGRAALYFDRDAAVKALISD